MLKITSEAKLVDSNHLRKKVRQWLLYYKRSGPQDKSFPSFYRQKITKYNSSKQQSSFSYNFCPTVYSTAAVEHKFPISMTQHPTQSHVISMPPNYFKIHFCYYAHLSKIKTLIQALSLLCDFCDPIIFSITIINLKWLPKCKQPIHIRDLH